MTPSLSIRRIVINLPIPRKLTLIIGLFSVVVFGLLLLSFIGMSILSGSRAYVGGEGLWSKGQKEAAYRLSRYAHTHLASDYEAYQTNIVIPLGDHKALIELSRVRVDNTAVGRGFVEGRNHPADVDIMIFMARRFRNFPYMNKALAIWAQADQVVMAIPPLAKALHREIASGHPSPVRVQELLDQIRSIDDRLAPMEDDFSYTLGEGARWLKRVVMTLMIGATLLFLAATLVIAFLISRHLCEEIDRLRAGASRIAAGDYSQSLYIESKDEIGELARTFQQMANERQQAERLKDEFFANVSHELRTPLTLILSPLESLLSGDYGSIESTVRPLLQTMHNNTVRLLQLVNGVLDFSKLEAGKITANRDALRIADLTETIYKDFQPMMELKGLKAELGATPRDVIVMMDRYIYERILFNLLSNAIKFTLAGGRVTVHLTWADEQLTLKVSDTGVGIPAEELQNIFQRFRQVEGSSTRRFEGTGLGLSLVKEFAALLEGTVSVESTTGQGSIFTVTCSAPLGQEAAAATGNSPSDLRTLRAQQYAPDFSVVSDGTSSSLLPKVLIAEDNAEMASYIATLLHSLCQTKVSRNGRDALQKVQAWSPDLILTDVMMPESDGLSLCQEVKSNPATAAIPVVMLTALTHRDALLDGWKAGANEYLYKPFHPKELVTRVQTLLKARQDQKQADSKITLLNNHLNRHTRDLETANQELEAFSYSVSHDLRAPLRAIDGFSKELLANCGADLDDRGKADLQRIRAATQRMAHLIDDLLELSRLSHSKLRSETIDLSEEAKQIIQELQNSEPQRRVDCDIAPQLVATGDPHLLHIALQNLLANAWKFTQRESPAKIEFGLSGQNGKRTYFIRDNGVGFDMAYAGKLFKAFQRLHDVKDFPGTGIGLALVQRIVQRHGGEIWVEAEENRGATFYFTL